jgi:class 3 adenylate cyclase
MRIEADVPCPLPEGPVLAAVAAALRDTGDWGWVVDRDWRLLYVTNEQRLSFSAGVEMVPLVIGEHLFGPAMAEISSAWRTGPTRPELWGELFSLIGGLVLADTARGKDELLALVDASMHDIVQNLSPVQVAAVAGLLYGMGTSADHLLSVKALRIRDDTGARCGTMIQYKPAAGMDVLGAMAFERDLSHLERMRTVSRAGRRPAAILFADLEQSSALSRTLSTGSYFALGRRIVRETDRCIVDAGGLVGRHVGDGIAAFFPVETFHSESGAARACISAARSAQEAMDDVAKRSELAADDLVMRFGLHWGSTLYMGNISTVARSEVTALGDEVNEAARIEACATGGRILASKPLLERLDTYDAGVLKLDPDHVTYTKLADLDTATDKARRDAPAVAVCEL